jgi:phage gp46-like protein
LPFNNGESAQGISTADWVKGLAINILLTDALMPATNCGYKPGQAGGFWGDSYAGPNQSSGSLLRKVKAGKTTAETVSAIKRQAEFDLQKLVKYGVAKSVEVDVNYSGNNLFSLVAKIFGSNNANVSTVDLSGSPLANGFVWN